MSLTYSGYLTQISIRSVADPTGVCPIISIVGSGLAVTIRCIATVPFQIGAEVTIGHVSPSAYNGTYIIATSSNAGGVTTFTFASTTASLYVSGGLAGTDPNLIAFTPSMISNAELRILRDLDLLNTLTSNTTISTTALNNTISLPQGSFVTIRSIQVLTPVGLNTRADPLINTSEEFILNTWNVGTDPGTPELYSVYGGDTSSPLTTPFRILLGPTPDGVYNLSIRGTVRPTSLFILGQSNPSTATTYISANLEDLFVMATMIEVSAYQRNWGRESDDPQMALSYLSQYKELLGTAGVEEARKKFEAAGWTSQSNPSIATPNR